MAETLGHMGELGVIARITRMLPQRGDIIMGAGDDCAVVRLQGDAAEDLVLTSDPVVSGVHFRSDAPIEAVGHKAAGRVLSDMAAMGATPRWALVDIVAPAEMPMSMLEALYAGMGALAADHGLAIVGGDMAEGACLEIHVFGVGAVPAGEAIGRCGARAGDRLFVTGALGGSRLGRHLRVEPRVDAGQWLRAHASAMIDISDGLGTDLRHLAAASGVGCDLIADRVPVAEAARRMHDAESALSHALYDGEDFELLFTVSEDRAETVVAAWRETFSLSCTAIGWMTPDANAVRLIHSDGTINSLDRQGYAHWQNKSS